jgi:hypothetical protein
MAFYAHQPRLLKPRSRPQILNVTQRPPIFLQHTAARCALRAVEFFHVFRLQPPVSLSYQAAMPRPLRDVEDSALG